MNRYLSYTLTLVLLSWSSLAFSQEIKGIVFDLESSERLVNIKVINLSNKETVATDGQGNFSIKGNLNDNLVLSGLGYNTDTVFVFEEGVQRLYLLKDENTLVINEVYITRLTDSQLDREIQSAENQGKVVDASQHRGGLRISPSRLFGSKGKQARNSLKLLLEEKDNRKIDRVFTNKLVRSMLPLDDSELALFREGYRPTLEFIENSSEEQLRIYISESYQKFREENPKKN